jgi:hypothetical protein
VSDECTVTAAAVRRLRWNCKVLSSENCEVKSCLDAALSIHAESQCRPMPANGASNRQVTFSLLTLNETIVNLFSRFFFDWRGCGGNHQLTAFVNINAQKQSFHGSMLNSCIHFSRDYDYVVTVST